MSNTFKKIIMAAILMITFGMGIAITLWDLWRAGVFS